MIRFGICNELFEGWDLAKTCEAVRSLGYEGLELAPFTLAPRITDLGADRRREIRATIEAAGLQVIGLHWLLAKTSEFHLTSPDAEVRRRTADYLAALAEATRDLGGTLMVFGSPKQRDLPPGVSRDDAMTYASEVLRSVSGRLDACGVDLCMEPLAPSETNFLTSIAEASDLIRMVDHERVTLHLDVKAMSSDPGGSVVDLIRRHASEAGHFHANDVNLRGPGMGEIEFEPILRALVDADYRGWVSVEVFDFTPGPEETARRSLETLRKSYESARKR